MSSNPMASAPLDGTRVLIQSQVFAFLPEKQGSHFRVHKPVDARWVECKFLDGRWQESAGAACTITPLAWAPVPC